MIDDENEGNIMNYIRKLAIRDVGKCKVSQGEFQEVDLKADEYEEDFVLEEEEAIDITEKQPFRKSIGLGPEKKSPIIHSPPSLLIGKCSFSFGHNPGNSTVIIIEGKICKAMGVNIFLEGQIFSGHNHEITYLFYDKTKSILISGTQGKCSEVRLWNVVKTQEKVTINEYIKTNLPLNSLGVAFTWLLDANTLAVITKYSFHSQSQLFITNLADMKRNRCQCKLNKVIMLYVSERCLVLNEKGLSELKITQGKKGTLQTLIQVSRGSTFTVLEFQRLIVLGSLNGTLSVQNSKGKICIDNFNAHQRQVLSISELEGRKFATSGTDKKLIIFEIDSTIETMTKIHVLQLSSPCYNILNYENKLFCSLRTTYLTQIKLTQEKSIKMIDKPLDEALIYPIIPNSEVKPRLIYNKYMKKYIYSLSGYHHISILNIDEKGNLIGAKKVFLSKPPLELDVHGNILGYISSQHEYQKINTIKSNLSGFFKNKDEIVKEELILEDFTSSTCLGKLSLPEQSRCTCLKFNEDGDKLILGFQNGTIQLYNVNKPEKIILIKASKLHFDSITDFIWSKGGNIVKSISNINVIYLDILKDKEQIVPVYTTKGLKETQWSQCGKFDWKNFHVWNNHLHVPSDITDIKETSEYLLACMSDGSLKTFRNPAGKQYQKLIRLFNKAYICSVVSQGEDRFSVLFASGGIIFCLEIGDYFSEDDCSEISSEDKNE